MENEIWKDVYGYEGLYQVSNLGIIKSLIYNNTGKKNILRPGVNTGGYYCVVLSKNRIKKMYTVHQLVAVCFLNHVPNGMNLVINHKDFNKLNNHVDNLEIVTSRENSNRKHLKSSSQYVGVYWYKKTGKWKSQIMVEGKKKHIGYFANEIEASKAYQNKLIEIL